MRLVHPFFPFRMLLLSFTKKPLEGSDCFFRCLLWRVMEGLVLIMV